MLRLLELSFSSSKPSIFKYLNICVTNNIHINLSDSLCLVLKTATMVSWDAQYVSGADKLCIIQTDNNWFWVQYSFMFYDIQSLLFKGWSGYLLTNNYNK